MKFQQSAIQKLLTIDAFRSDLVFAQKNLLISPTNQIWTWYVNPFKTDEPSKFIIIVSVLLINMHELANSLSAVKFRALLLPDPLLIT